MIGITVQSLERARAYARESGTTFHNLRRFVEIMAEDAHRAERAKAKGIALDAAPRVSRFMDPLCSEIASQIWDEVQQPDPLPFFAGVPWSVGMARYNAHVAKPKSKEARYV